MAFVAVKKGVEMTAVGMVKVAVRAPRAVAGARSVEGAQ